MNLRLKQKCSALSIAPTGAVILVSIRSQELACLREGHADRHYRVSTSLRPPSNRENSFGTPTGLHTIATRIGAGAPKGMVFKGRQPTGRRFQDMAGDELGPNLITSRILRLRGLEPEVNRGPGVDSFDRYIYIHGTNHEDRIGKPFSGGCIELRNDDVTELFDQVEEGDLVWIE